MNREEANFSVNFAPFITERNVCHLMEELAEADRHLAQNVNAKLIFFDLALRITTLLKK